MNANSLATIAKWKQTASQHLKHAGIPSHDLDTLILLENITGLSRAHILAHGDKELNQEQVERLNSLLQRRLQREPMAYITQTIEFYGRNFFINQDVLIPRPESESFLTLIKKLGLADAKVLDVGCGSGAIGITVSLEYPKYDVTLSDISPLALKVAELNAKRLHAKVGVVKQDLLGNASQDYTVVIANLPYVPKTMLLEPELSYEPALALFSDNKGLALYEQFWQAVQASYVLTESLTSQHKSMQALAKGRYILVATEGLVQLFKRV